MSLNDRDYEEKRDFIRMTMNAEAKLSYNGAAPIDVTCSDLSAKGISVVAPEPIDTGVEVTISVQSPNAQFKSMESTGTVLRCNKKSEKSYEIGVEITSIK